MHDDERGMYFRPVSPGDYLKMHTWQDENAKNLAHKVRGKVKQGTLCKVQESLQTEITGRITNCLSSIYNEKYILDEELLT